MENYAYIAGLLDGEGSIMLLSGGPNRSRGAWVSIGLSDTEPQKYLCENLGGHIKTTPNKVPRKDMHVWSVKDYAALSLLECVRPFLVIERRRALAEMLVNEFPRARHGKETTETAAWRKRDIEALWARMQERNSQRLSELPKMARSNPCDADFAYLAGILDGEGWIKPKATPGSLVVEVVSTDPELPAWLKSKFGGSTGLHKPEAGNSRAVWYWKVGQKEGLAALRGALRFMLLERKRKRVNEWLGDTLIAHLPGTVEGVAARAGINTKLADKKLRTLFQSGAVQRERVPRGRNEAGRPKWRYV